MAPLWRRYLFIWWLFLGTASFDLVFRGQGQVVPQNGDDFWNQRDILRLIGEFEEIL